jgi:hypothetical protein
MCALRAVRSLGWLASLSGELLSLNQTSAPFIIIVLSAFIQLSFSGSPIDDCITDDHYNIPVTCASEVAQVSMFLGVVCSIFMGVSHHAGNLIMCIIFMILYLITQNGDSSTSAPLKHTVPNPHLHRRCIIEV